MPSKGGFLSGGAVSLADFTWFPTVVFMEFMLPKYGWSATLFQDEGVEGEFGKLAAWYSRCRGVDGFARTRQEIRGYWKDLEKEGQFEPILEEICEAEKGGLGLLKFKYP